MVEFGLIVGVLVGSCAQQDDSCAGLQRNAVFPMELKRSNFGVLVELTPFGAAVS